VSASLHPDRADALAQQRWVLTGAAGTIGSSLRAGLADRVAELVLVDVVELAAVHPRERPRIADVCDLAAITAACADAHGIVHLAGIPVEADFAALAAVNVVGTYRVLEAARVAGAGRVVLASSNHATGMYPATATEPPLHPDMAVRPDSLYGVSKVAGEALGRMYADKLGLAVAAIRIGSFQPAPRNERELSTWLSPRDCLAAVLAAMTAPGLDFAAFYGVSRNARRWWDLAAGEALGYHPRDDAEEHAAGLTGVGGPYPFQGGSFADPAYTIERQRTERTAG